MLSHELRSPLGAILTWVTLLRDGQLDGALAARGLEAIERNTRLQVKLIEDLLDVSRIITGQDAARGRARRSRRASSRPRSRACAPPAPRRASRIDACRRRPTSAPCSGDATRLQQVVWNLLSNAVKFTPQGRPGRGPAASGRDSQALIQVADTGKGIDPAFLPHIFERFRQADSSTTRAEGGLGLGLAIVRHLVELHGGTVEAAEPGPRRRARRSPCACRPSPALPRTIAGAARAAARSTAATPRALDGVRVLVVDDEPDAREAIAAVLESAGATRRDRARACARRSPRSTRGALRTSS